ncbi:Transacylase cctO-like protein [Cladobotryum mycophilum]|uniref:Transacylase cctO-like protein n=1 Tax=Cladobotryum mycophilum TaxID=491253 RepID=A0ABR0SZV9_9HYPO
MASNNQLPKIVRWHAYKVLNEKDSDTDSEAPLIEENRLLFWRRERPQRNFLLAQAGILVLYILVTAFAAIFVLRGRLDCPCNNIIHSPAKGHVHYERVAMDNSLDDQNPFKGIPREELHSAWRGLLKYMNIRVQEKDLVKINRTSVPLNDEKGGYLATLDVFHELHCLNVVREQVYREYYPDKHSKAKQLEHADHCIDMLRQVLMCHGDIAVQTFGWRDDYRWPWPNFRVDHECRNWDAIMEWAGDNYVENLRGPVVTHPTLGISWREGDED